MVGTGIPVFWLGMTLQFVFFYKLHWLPLGARFPIREAAPPVVTGFLLVDSLLVGSLTDVVAALKHLALPAATIVINLLAVGTRLTRAALIREQDRLYVRTARGKGLSPSRILFKHVLRNALSPILTATTMQFGYMISWVILVEVIFDWPGIGLYAYQSFEVFDYSPPRRGSGFQRGLATHDLFEFLIELFLIQQLAAGGAVHFRAQFRDAVFVGVLHFRLACDQPGENVVAEREIGRSRRRPDAERRHGPDHNPEHHGPEPDLFAGVYQGIATLCVLGGSRSGMAGADRAAGDWSAVVVRVVLRILGMMARTIRHRHSRAGRKRVPYGQSAGVI